MKIEIPEQKKLVHTMEMEVRWGDMDAMGHVNNAVYFRYRRACAWNGCGPWAVSPIPRGRGR